MEISGKVVSKIFEAQDGYAVVQIEGDEPTIVVGVMPHLSVGSMARFFGQYRQHPKYGDQFVCEHYETMMPEDTDAMAAFLASDFVKGLGPVLSKRLVDTFGEDTFRVIEEEPERLYAVRGISKKVADSLHERFMEETRDQHRYAALIGLGLSPKQAVEAERVLGGGAAEMIRKDPYVLVSTVRGIDFIRADDIARRLGITSEDPRRVASALLHMLNLSMRAKGYMCVPRDILLNNAANKIHVDRSLAENVLDSLTLDGQIVIRRYGESEPALVFLRDAASKESTIACQLLTLKYTTATHQREVARVPVKIAGNVELSTEQRRALATAWDNSVCVITGGPGTGKTTIIRAALSMFGGAGLQCSMAAPTGRAAKRMEQATGRSASTIHRLLEFSFEEEDGTSYFARNEENPLDADVVIIDEMSMTDTSLFDSLVRAVKPGSRLLMIGDADQLPSVGPGNVLRDLISSRTLATVQLTHRYRNAGRIADGAHEILCGRMPDFDSQEFVFLDRPTAEEVHSTIRTLYMRARRAGHDVQVLSPVKQETLGPLHGAIELNNMLREAVNPAREDAAEIVWQGRLFREGDRVMQTVNDYRREWVNPEENEDGTGVFNGDLGVVEAIVGPTMRIRFDDGRLASYERDELGGLSGAFAYTIHKSQGSEFETVIMPMLYVNAPFLSRSLLYTGITRAKRRVVLVGTRDTCWNMIRNDVRGERYTGLSQELRLYDAVMAASSRATG